MKIEPFIVEIVGGGAERAAFAHAGEYLQAALAAASDVHWPVNIRWHGGDGSAPPGAILVPLIADCACAREPWADTEARLRREFQEFAERGPPVFVCTIFRHVSEETAHGAPHLRERIRRLNRLAASLSHDFGIYVIDLDRMFAGVGARTFASDYKLSGTWAASFAGHAMASTLMAAGLDECFPADTQERAKQYLADYRPHFPPAPELTVSPITLGFQTVRNGKRRQVFSQHTESFLPKTLNIAERWHRLRGQLETGQMSGASALVILMRSAGRIVRNRLSISRGTRE